VDAPDIVALEAAFLTAWPAIKSAHDRHWLWRWADGYSKRGNSLQCHDPDDAADIPARLARFMAMSRRHGIPPLVRLTPLAPPALVAAIDAEAWATIEPSRVLVMPLAPTAPAPDATPDATPDVAVLPGTDRRWSDAEARLSDYDARNRHRLDRIVDLIAVPSAGVVLHDDAGDPVAAALVVNTGTIAVFLNVVVDAARRGRGLGRRLMTAGLDWAAATGATHAALQVLADNRPALALYRSLGFVDRYGYSYRRAPDAAATPSPR
jgi:ribosomal protein S18 acetylase RimI-like enzyme